MIGSHPTGCWHYTGKPIDVVKPQSLTVQFQNMQTKKKDATNKMLRIGPRRDCVDSNANSMQAVTEFVVMSALSGWAQGLLIEAAPISPVRPP
jgi:hypothetical protein